MGGRGGNGGRNTNMVGPQSQNKSTGTPPQEFNDVSRYSLGDRDMSAQFEYNGDGSKQIEFFKKYSNAYDLIQKMSSAEKNAFLRWAEGRFMHGEGYLDWDQMPRRHQEWTKVYDKILDKATLSRGVMVTRDTTAEILFGKGKLTGTLDEFKAMEGRTIFSKGSMSTGAAKTGLGIGSSSGKQVRLRIHIPEGSKGAGMWIGDRRIHGWGARQLEFMTNRDSYFKVGKTTFDKSSGMYEVHVTWIGHGEHDYGKKKKRR